MGESRRPEDGALLHCPRLCVGSSVISGIEDFLFQSILLSKFRKITVDIFSDRKGPRKLKIKQGCGSSHGFHHLLRSPLLKKRLQERQP